MPIWPECNLNCVFCSNPVEGYRKTTSRYTFERFRKKWELYQKGKESFLKFNAVDDFASMTGGEPTLNPDFLKILALVRKTWPKKPVKLLTNARMMRYPAFAEKTLRLGGDFFEIKIPFFGPDEKSYNSIARTPGAFADACAGIENLLSLRRPGQTVTIRIILHKLQLKWLEGLLDFLPEKFRGIDGVELLFVEYEGHARQNFKALKLSLSDCGKKLGKLEPKLRGLPEFKLLHFPLCVLPKKLWPNAWRTLDPIKVVFPTGCSGCAAKKICVGVHKSYAECVGTEEFKPVKSLRGIVLSGNRYRPVESIKI